MHPLLASCSGALPSPGSEQRLEALLNGLVDVGTLMTTLPGVIKKGVQLASTS